VRQAGQALPLRIQSRSAFQSLGLRPGFFILNSGRWVFSFIFMEVDYEVDYLLLYSFSARDWRGVNCPAMKND
jgi:hypothetical protein